MMWVCTKEKIRTFILKKEFKVVPFEANLNLVKFCKERFSPFIKSEQLTIVEGAIINSENYREDD